MYDAVFLMSVVIEMRYIVVKINEMFELGAFPRRFWMHKIILAGFSFRVVLMMVCGIAGFGWSGVCPFDNGKVVILIATECAFEFITRVFVVYRLQI